MNPTITAQLTRYLSNPATQAFVAQAFTTGIGYQAVDYLAEKIARHIVRIEKAEK